MKRKHRVAFVAGAIAGITFAWQGHAQALLDRLYPASMCHDAAGTGVLQDAQWQVFGAAGSYSTVVCPMIDERADDAGGLEHSEVAYLNVHGHDSSNKGWACALACTTEFGVWGGECGGGYACSSYEGTGNYTLTLDSAAEMSAWRSPYNTFDFAYVRVEMSMGYDATTSGSHRFRGYYITGE